MDYVSNKDLINLLRRLVQIPTENPPGITKEIVNYLITDVLREEEGFSNHVIPYRKNNHTLHNLVSKMGDGKKNIVFTGHFDVIPAGNSSDWKYPPFSADIKDNKLFGRGSADMKGGLTMLISVMKNLSKNSEFLKKYCIVFAGTADEELGMTGSLNLINEGVMDNADLLVIAEPTNMNIGVAEKGLLWVKLILHGKAAHGSMPENGINSIVEASKIIPRLFNFLDNEVNPILGTSSLNIGKINGGTVINVVPDKTELELDFRLIPEHNPDILVDKIKELKTSSCTLDFEILKKLPAIYSDTNLPFIQKLRKLSGGRLIGLPYATDGANFIDPDKSIPFVIFGPGDPSIAHTVNEYIELDSLLRATDVLTRAFLETYSLKR